MMNEPLYVRISEDIRSKIKSGEIPYGSRLPAERQMAENYGVDRKTLRKAIALLSEEGILNCMQGKGTYIAKPQIPYQVEMLDDLEQMILSSGMEPSTRVLYTESRKAGRKYAALLEVEKDTEIFRILRLRSGNGEPIALMDSYVVSSLVPEIETVDFEMHSLYGVLKQNGIEVRRIDEKFTFAEISNPEAAILKIEENGIAFVTDDRTYDQYQRAVEYTKSVINPQKLSIDVSFRLK